MDINNNLQINTFTKGMDTDSSDMYIGEGSYRYAENLRVVTDEDSNSGELHIIEGTNKVFTIIPGQEDTNEYVDLGLPSGIKWAKCNLGATNPYDYGSYYSWGNVDGHILGENGYSFSDLTYSNSIGASLNEEIPTDTMYDAARSQKGSGWRMPKKDDFLELLEYTTSEWVTNYHESGIDGTLFTASNGNSIFLPAAGYYKVGNGNNQPTTPTGSPDLYGMYWTSSYSNYSPDNAYEYSPSRDWGVRLNLSSRARGCSIRPVYNKSWGNAVILGYTTIRNYIIVIVKRSATVFGQSQDEWAIFKYDANDGFRKTLVAGWFTKRIWPDDWDANERKTKPLSLVTRWESKDNVKLYIANKFTGILSVNIMQENLGDDFDKIFQMISGVLMPPIAEVSSSSGANIPGVVVQYGYILYKKRGVASTLSMLSQAVSSGVNSVTGFRVDENSTNIINVTLPSDVVGQNVRLYRICYSRSGQLPKVDIIYDLICELQTIGDFGQSLQSVSTAEFIATNKLLFSAAAIESKGDYLFAGNISYHQDEVDEYFKDFDARCYSSGSYYLNNGTRVNIGANASDELLANIPFESLHHDQFDSFAVEFNPLYWNANSDGYNGHGLCFNWKYKYEQDVLNVESGYQSAANGQTKRTYARNEVYRFGVKLYDSTGRSSSVKWIADIKMPDYFNPNGDATTMQPYIENYDFSGGILNLPLGYINAKWKINNLSIEFVPIPGDRWNGVYKYEIVLAKRGIDDSYKLMQGISGFPQIAGDESDSPICVPYFLTTQNFDVGRGIAIREALTGGYSMSGFQNADEWDLKNKPYNVYKQDKNLLLFISPEYIYQPDDVKSLLKLYNTSIFHHTVALYEYTYECKSDTVNTFNEADYLYNNEQYTSNNLYYLTPSSPTHDHNADLRICVYPGSTGRPAGTYYLNMLAMDAYNYTRTNGNNPPRNEPLGGWVRAARKTAFFTTIVSRNELYLPASNNLQIKDVTCYDASLPEDFAKDEKCTIKNKFTTLKNGKKFYNWTNPALLDKKIYWISCGDGSDRDLLYGWKNLTMTAFDSEWNDCPYEWVTDHGANSWEDYLARAGSQALTFPTSPGGSGIILETGASTYTYFPETFSFSTSAGAYTMPPITVANIYKSATPYGGYSVQAINNTLYIGEGFVANRGENITVSMGDNHITAFTYMLYHNFDNASHDSVTSAATQYIVPVESTMDLLNTCSDYIQPTHTSTLPVPGKGVWILTKPNTNAGRFTQTTDLYLYNTAYSVNPDIITYSAEDVVNASDSLYDSRVVYSQKKLNNELIDSWTSFKAIDYLDVDSRYGQITGLKLFKDKLIFLQENGAGVLSVNDRIILKDQESANIIVGNGGVLDRYDYFTMIYGMKPDQHAVEVSNDALYWWDGYRKEIIGYADGYNINLLQRIKNVANYINKGEESDTPSIVYDANNKEVLFNVVNNKCIVYNEQTLQFTAIYTFNPIYYSNVGGNIYLTDQWKTEEHLYAYNEDNTDGDGPKLFETIHKPTLKYIVNREPTYNKVFDVLTFGGRFYGGSSIQTTNNNIKHLFPGEHNNNPLHVLTFTYNTPTKQESTTTGDQVTNYEYDYRLVIPRNKGDKYGGRMRGKTMECTLTSSSNNKDFSIQYITTKYRMSWT